MASEHTREYHKKRPIRIAVSSILSVILVILAIYSLSINNYSLTFEEAWGAVMNRINGIAPQNYEEWMIDYVAIEVNAPRAFAAVFIGTILAICGAVMQTVTHNPLAEPYTIGISSAALFGVTISVIFGFSIIPGLTGTAAAGATAFLFAMIPAAVIVLFSSFKKLSPNMMILVGIGMMYLFSAMTTFLKFNASEEKLQEIYIWGLGTLTETTWDELISMGLCAGFVLIFFMLAASDINVLMAGDKTAQSLGVNPVLMRIICFLVVTLGVAVAVCYTGTIGFVGLVAPHIARLFTGNNNKILIPASAIVGSLLILISDIIVRSLPGGLPAGVMTALIGSPIFIYFLFSQRKKSRF